MSKKIITSGEQILDKQVVEKVIHKGFQTMLQKVRLLSDQKTELTIKMINTFKVREKFKNIYQKIEHEGSVLKQLDFPSVVKQYDIHKEKDNIYLVLEYLEGESLSSLIMEKGQISEQETIKIITTILYTVNQFDNMKLIQRSFCPENILLIKGKFGNVEIKIIDFGVSIVGTKAEGVAGTPNQLAPEILQDKDQGSKVDIWSLGVLWYIMLSGFPPFNSPNPEVMFRKIKSFHISIDPERGFHHKEFRKVSMDTKQIITRMLDADQANRISIKELIKVEMFNKSDSMLDNIGRGLQDIKNTVIENLQRQKKDPYFVRAIKMFMARVHNVEHLEILRSLFLSKDDDKGGRLDKEEFSQILQNTLEMPENSADSIFRAINVSKDEFIDFTEFLAATATFTDTDCAKVIQSKIDEDNSKSITMDEFEHFMKENNINLTESSVKEIFNEIDDNQDGTLTQGEFKRQFTRQFKAQSQPKIQDQEID